MSPFTIPDNDVAGVPARQSPWYSTDIAILVAALAGTGVLTGCAVTAQGSPDMTLAVASGTIQPSAGVAEVNVTGGNVNISAAHATLPRIDLVTASAAGVKTVTPGTASAEPKPPDLPSGHIALAMIDVPATDTAIQTAQITDKRAMVFASSAGGGVTVQDEGSPLSTVADTLDFVGAGVVASGTGTTKTITISGAGIDDILDLTTAEMDDSLVLAPDGAGGVEFRAEAGGAATPWSPDTPPDSPSAYDDEFDALSGWTTLGTLDTSNVTDFPGRWHAERVEGGVAINGIYKTCPSTPFTITTKLSAAKMDTNYQAYGIMLTESGPGKLACWGLVVNTNLYTSVYRMTNRTTLGTNTDVNIGSSFLYGYQYPYMKMLVASANDITCSVSRDGMLWKVVHTSATTNLTPANFGLWIGSAAGGGTYKAVFDWVRIT